MTIEHLDGKLSIFEDFWVDSSLPKFRAKKAQKYELKSNRLLGDNEGENSSEPSESWESWGSSRARFIARNGFLVGSLNPAAGFWSRVRSWFTPAPKMSVREFFESVKNSTEELVIVDSRADGYEKLLREAKESGQEALVERLISGMAAIRSEAQLIAMGATKYVTEDTIVRFSSLSQKGLRLDWIRNFTRAIPSEVLEKKRAADEREVFDNYVVLHYDPQNRGVAPTKAEIAAKKDPILFGLMEGRRRLYYVGDWVDEYCDLTLDKIADIVGAGAVSELK